MAADEKQTFLGKVMAYLELRVQYVGLQAQAKINAVIGRMLFGISMLFMCVSFLWFLSFALAHVVGKWLDKPWLGFLIAASIYGVIIGVAYIKRRTVLRLIGDFLTEQANALTLEKVKETQEAEALKEATETSIQKVNS
jgi:hypothetical protein